MPVVAILFGWPAIVASVVLVMTGISLSRWPLTLAGAAVAMPFLLYVWASPRFGATTAVPVALLYFGAAWAVARGRTGMAFAFSAPFLALVTLMARLVLGQHVR